MGSLDFRNRPRITGNHRVRCQKSDPFDHRLSNQDAVEGIFVYGWKGVYRNRVLTKHGKFLVAVFQASGAESHADQTGNRNAQSALQRSLPNACIPETNSFSRELRTDRAVLEILASEIGTQTTNLVFRRNLYLEEPIQR